ncbi:MAG: FhaA domain-containing protein [Acidimicrobiales bacterium]
MGLQQFEQRLERLVEGAFAKAFRSGLQPVEIGRRITREMDLGRRVGVRGLIAPNYFKVNLPSADYERFSTFLDSLARELGDAAREHARTEGYEFMGPVQVEIFDDPEIRPNRYSIDAQVREGPDGLPAGSIRLSDGRRITVGTQSLVLGRLPECAVVLNDPNVSRRHAEIRRRGSDVVVVDLGSTNGTRVNGMRVKEQLLNDGDEIEVGTSTVVFEAS